MGAGECALVKLDLAGVFTPDNNSCTSYMCVSHHTGVMLSWSLATNVRLRKPCVSIEPRGFEPSNQVCIVSAQLNSVVELSAFSWPFLGVPATSRSPTLSYRVSNRDGI